MNDHGRPDGVPENEHMTDHDFDDRLRRMHARALEQVSPRTRAQLDTRHPRARSPATAGRDLLSGRPLWALASAFALGALAIGLALRAPVAPTPSATPNLADAPETTSYEDAYAVFDESPDLYLWLESDAAALLQE